MVHYPISTLIYYFWFYFSMDGLHVIHVYLAMVMLIMLLIFCTIVDDNGGASG